MVVDDLSYFFEPPFSQSYLRSKIVSVRESVRMNGSGEIYLGCTIWEEYTARSIRRELESSSGSLYLFCTDEVQKRSDLIIKKMEVDEFLQLTHLRHQDGCRRAARWWRKMCGAFLFMGGQRFGKKKLRGNILGGGRIRTLRHRSKVTMSKKA